MHIFDQPNEIMQKGLKYSYSVFYKAVFRHFFGENHQFDQMKGKVLQILQFMFTLISTVNRKEGQEEEVQNKRWQPESLVTCVPRHL